MSIASVVVVPTTVNSVTGVSVPILTKSVGSVTVTFGPWSVQPPLAPAHAVKSDSDPASSLE